MTDVWHIKKNCTNQLTGTLIKGGSLLTNKGEVRDGKQVWCTGQTNGEDVKIPPNCVEPYIVGQWDAPSYEPVYKRWHPDRSILVPDDVEDLSSCKLIKGGTVVDDWNDNQDGTYDITLNGIEVFRIREQDAMRLLL